jgi:hypothetical protein
MVVSFERSINTNNIIRGFSHQIADVTVVCSHWKWNTNSPTNLQNIHRVHQEGSATFFKKQIPDAYLQSGWPTLDSFSPHSCAIYVARTVIFILGLWTEFIVGIQSVTLEYFMFM